MRTKTLRSGAVLAINFFITTFTVPTFAIDSTSIEVATGNSSTFVRAGIQWDWEKRWFQSNGTHLGGYWDLTAAKIRQNRYQNIFESTKNLYNLGITPVFRFQADNKTGWYAEGGIGANYFSNLYDNNDRQFSTRFQFGDHIGIGYILDNKWDLGLKIQHFSNGSIKQPNDGANFIMLKAGYIF